MIDDLAQFGTPVLLFSGGEPFLRADLMELIDYAGNYGIRTVVSTNGTLIDRHVAQDLKAVRIAYVGISLDGTEETNDRFRGVKGAFSAAMRGISACQEEGIKVGLRFTVNVATWLSYRRSSISFPHAISSESASITSYMRDEVATSFTKTSPMRKHGGFSTSSWIAPPNFFPGAAHGSTDRR